MVRWKQRRPTGFTLVELLVVTAIIGLLAGISMISLTFVRAKARDAQRKSMIRQEVGALAQFYQDNSEVYPNAGGRWQNRLWLQGQLAPYLREIQADPLWGPPSGTYQQPWYWSDSLATTYRLWVYLENRQDPDRTGIVFGWPYFIIDSP